MLTISTIPEALAELEKSTRRAWTESELFDLAVKCDIELHAAPPITARTTIQKFVIGEGLVEKFRSGPGHALLAVLFPWQVAQLWVSGETKTSHPSKHDEMEGEYQLFTEPVRIIREQVRIKAATLQKMFAVWSQAQAGRWIEDTTKPGDMRYQNCPEWMFPAEEFVPVQTAATTEPVVADRRRKKKPSIESVAFDYMRKEYQSGQFESAVKFHKHLTKTAGLDKSPFEMGTGTNARKLFCPAAGSFFDAGTLSNMWSKIRDS